ncbi:hypothetical protein L9F63_025540, partial [Diploptera punctata]
LMNPLHCIENGHKESVKRSLDIFPPMHLSPRTAKVHIPQPKFLTYTGRFYIQNRTVLEIFIPSLQKISGFYHNMREEEFDRVYQRIQLEEQENRPEEGHFEICSLFLESGVDVNACTNAKKSALHIACERGNLEICVDVKYCDELGRTPLFYFSSKGITQACKIILNKHGSTALHIAAEKGNSEIRVDIHLYIKQHGRDIQKYQYNMDTLIGCTPLYYAAYNGNSEMSLHRAVECNNMGVVQLLMQHKANVTLDSNGRTPLHIAAEKGHIGVCKLLLEADERNCEQPDGNRPGNQAASPNLTHQVDFVGPALNMTSMNVPCLSCSSVLSIKLRLTKLQTSHPLNVTYFEELEF